MTVAALGPLAVIGYVQSSLRDRESAPRQGDEGAPEAWLVFEPGVESGLRDIATGEELWLFTWLDRARRDVLVVHPRDDRGRPETGVFSTRSADRPNPIGLHRIRVLARDGMRLRVSGLEALDGTPILDLKPLLGAIDER